MRPHFTDNIKDPNPRTFVLNPETNGRIAYYKVDMKVFSPKQKKEMKRWCFEKFGHPRAGNKWVFFHDTFCFLQEEDLVHFKLVWQ